MNGIVQSGGTGGDIRPIGGALVGLYEAAQTKSVLIAEARTDSSGAFTMSPAHTSAQSIFYLRAILSEDVVLMALVGPVLPAQVTINELTTVAAVYCARQFMNATLQKDGFVNGSARGLRIAAGMSTNVVNLTDGTSSVVLTSSPNADETITLRETRALANLLAECVRAPEQAVGPLFTLTTPPDGNPPHDTVQAMLNIARYPANHVGPLFELSNTTAVYQPALEQQPDAWTLAVKMNDSGDDANMFGGPGNIAFDANDNAWITNNVVQGTPYSTNYSIVLDAVGKPAVNDQGIRMSPFTGGGLVGAGFGVDIDSKGQVWIGNFGWGKVNPTPSGSVSAFDLNANALSPADGYQAGIYRVQGTVVDDEDNVWLAGYGSNSVAVYPNGDAASALVYESNDPNFLPFGIAPIDGGAWVTNSYAEGSGIVQLSLTDEQLTFVRQIDAGQTLKGIVIDSLDNIWAGSGGDNYVYAFSSDGEPLGRFQRGGQDAPWGITLDGDDHIWVGNFGPLAIGSVFHGRLTQLAGANPETRPPGLNLGDPMTPVTGYTLPTAGSPVLLSDGTPLYGPDGPPCLIPMMRTTGVAIDQAGNVWTCNNWKPSFDNDLIGDPSDPIESANPGGDGVIIFLGLARPPVVG